MMVIDELLAVFTSEHVNHAIVTGIQLNAMESPAHVRFVELIMNSATNTLACY
jgi:hypothetical protein